MVSDVFSAPIFAIVLFMVTHSLQEIAQDKCTKQGLFDFVIFFIYDRSRFYIKKLEINLDFFSMSKNSNLLKTSILSFIDCLKYYTWTHNIHKSKQPNKQNNRHFVQIVPQAPSKSWPEKLKED